MFRQWPRSQGWIIIKIVFTLEFIQAMKLMNWSSSQKIVKVCSHPRINLFLIYSIAIIQLTISSRYLFFTPTRALAFSLSSSTTFNVSPIPPFSVVGHPHTTCAQKEPSSTEVLTLLTQCHPALPYHQMQMIISAPHCTVVEVSGISAQCSLENSLQTGKTTKYFYFVWKNI